MITIFAKKSLGQNFLHSKPTVEKIVEAGEVTRTDTVLEIGPGTGFLTEQLLAHASKVVAVEKDDRLMQLLQEKFSKEIAEGRLTLIHGDALEFNPSSCNLEATSYKLIANIPYYITGQFFRRFLSEVAQPNTMVALIQKEVADRIVAGDNKESLLSLSIKAYGTPKRVAVVGRGCFTPAPNVDSAIIAISSISKKFFDNSPEQEKIFFELIHAGFAHKRKMLLGNLREAISNSQFLISNKEFQKKNNFEKLFETLHISKDIRAEDLTLADWKKILTALTHA